jgi:hypothetical protein
MSRAAARPPGASANGADPSGSSIYDDEAGRCLHARGIEAAEVIYDHRFDSKDGAAAAMARELLLFHLGCDVAEAKKILKGLTEVFDAPYETKDDFSIALFQAMALCFDAGSSTSRWKGEHVPTKNEWSKTNPPRLMVITERRSSRDEAEAAAAAAAAAADGGAVGMARSATGRAECEEEAQEDGSPWPEEGAPGGGRTMTRSSASRRKRKFRPKVGGGSFAPFVAHANFPPRAAGGEDDEEVVEDSPPGGGTPGGAGTKKPHEPQESWQYAIGLERDARVPDKKDGIVKGDSTLDHALVVCGRDANKKEEWGVCQVLATVELHLIDSACQRFDRVSESDSDRTARVNIRSIELSTAGGAGPLGRQVWDTVGHVLWSRAALGLHLPPSLPLAVVAAKKAKGMTTQAEAADRLRWVYGNLLIPEECGGKFSFNVSSCGPFDGTSATSAVAVYLSVVLDGLAAGEKWIEQMQRKNPTPSVDPRPWPSSMCGRRLCFGGALLNLLDKVLVATPARMRELDLPISQGELYKGRVNLAEIRNAPDGTSLRGVVWSSSAPSEAPPVEAKASAREAQDRVMVKVTSKACHSTLLLPAHGLLWNLDSYPHVPGHAGRVLNLVSGSLHAIYNVDDLDSGLVQLMPDLQAAGYLPLRPKLLERQGRLSDMCQAFERLVGETLVPLALLGAVHADLRAGYLETANVLCHKDDLTLRLIDLDSLLMFESRKNLLKDPRIISPKNGKFAAGIKSAVEFVCLQAVCIATAWLQGKRMDSTADVDVRSKLEEEQLTTETIMEQYLVERVGRGASVDRDARKAYFSIPDSDACAFVLGEVRPILRNLLGESSG